MSEDNKVVPIRAAKPSKEGWGPREREALLLARLAAMSLLEYERARGVAAKELGCRLSWLDRKIDAIRHVKAEWFAHLPPAKDGRTAVGEYIPFIDNDGTCVAGFVVTTGHYLDKDWHLLVLADGNATVERSTPISDERRDQLIRQREESPF